jgi:hypothetical protein
MGVLSNEHLYGDRKSRNKLNLGSKYAFAVKPRSLPDILGFRYFGIQVFWD